MKFLFAGALAVFAAFTVPQTAQGAVFAAHLKMVNNGNGTYNLNYRLNEEANQGVTINISGPAPAQTVVRTLTFPNQAAGAQSVVWDGKNSSAVQVPAGAYSWEVVASTNNTGGTPYVKTVDGTAPQLTFPAPHGLDVNDVTTSTHFGEVYVSTTSGTVTGSGRVVPWGIFTLSNDLQDHRSQGNVPYSGGVTWPATSGPYRVHVAPDSDVFITDWSDAHSGVWIMDPDNPSAPFAELFDNSSRAASGLTVNHGSISSVYVEGVGPDRVMYALDEDYTDPIGTAGQTGSLWKHAIGETQSGFVAKPTIEYDDSVDNWISLTFPGEAVRDTNPNRPNSWFISQYRFTESATSPNMFHYNGTEVDWTSFADFNFYLDALALQGGFDINSDGTLMAAAGYQYVEIIDISNLEDMGEDSIVYFDPGVGNSHREIAFDAAGNFMATSSNTDQLIFYSKQGSNSFTTPNPVGGEIVIGESTVPGWELY